MDSEAVHNKSEAAKPEEVKQHDMWWCVSARHCTSCDDTQGLMYANIPALAMFCRFVSMLGLWLTSTKNNNKCFSRHLFGWEVAKKKNLFSYLILAKCLPSASRKQTFFLSDFSLSSGHGKQTSIFSLPGRFTADSLYWY